MSQRKQQRTTRQKMMSMFTVTALGQSLDASCVFSSPLTPSSEKLVPLRAEGALCFREVLMNVFSLVLYFSSQKVAALWNGSSLAERSKNWPSHKHILPSLPPACPFHGLCALSRSQSK